MWVLPQAPPAPGSESVDEEPGLHVEGLPDTVSIHVQPLPRPQRSSRPSPDRYKGGESDPQVYELKSGWIYGDRRMITIARETAIAIWQGILTALQGEYKQHDCSLPKLFDGLKAIYNVNAEHRRNRQRVDILEAFSNLEIILGSRVLYRNKLLTLRRFRNSKRQIGLHPS